MCSVSSELQFYFNNFSVLSTEYSEVLLTAVQENKYLFYKYNYLATLWSISDILRDGYEVKTVGSNVTAINFRLDIWSSDVFLMVLATINHSNSASLCVMLKRYTLFLKNTAVTLHNIKNK